jgi:carbamoyl-phosphate synthase large subunit
MTNEELKVVLTACGCPGASTLIRMLKEVPDRDITIVGTDMDDEAVGRFLVDEFYQVPHGQSEEYIPAMLSVVEAEQPDVLFPESTFEVQPLAEHKSKFTDRGVDVVVSDPEAIRVANNKFEMYEAISEQTDVDLPEYHLVTSLDEFKSAASELGYPANPVVFKPPVGKGSRGVRIVDPDVDRRELLLEEKPNSLYITLEEVEQIFANEEFPELLVMEHLEGGEETADSLCLRGDELLTSFKTVEDARWGVIVRGELVERPELQAMTEKILDAIPLSYCVNFQFIDGKLIEINPRVSTFIYQRDFLQAYLAIQLALGEISPQEAQSYRDDIDHGRRMVRYMDQVFHKDGNRIL